MTSPTHKILQDNSQPPHKRFLLYSTPERNEKTLAASHFIDQCSSLCRQPFTSILLLFHLLSLKLPVTNSTHEPREATSPSTHYTRFHSFEKHGIRTVGMETPYVFIALSQSCVTIYSHQLIAYSHTTCCVIL